MLQFQKFEETNPAPDVMQRGRGRKDKSMQRIEDDISTEINEKRILQRLEEHGIFPSTRTEPIIESTNLKQLQRSTFLCST